MIDFIYTNEATLRLAAFLGGFSLLAVWEWAKPKRELTQYKFKRWFSNIGMVACGTIIVRLVLPIAAVGVAHYVEHEQWGFTSYFEWPFWLNVVIGFILLDLAIYFQHVVFHVLPILWRFHRVHHTDLDFDVTTGLRFHPIEIFISALIKFSAIVAVGAPVLAVILFEISLNLMAMFTHSNIRLNKLFERVLRWFIVTPDMHRVHHSVIENETNSNFAFNISVWDRIFGTYMAEPAAGQQGMTIGLKGFRESEWQGLGKLLYIPFTLDVRGYAINYRDTKNEKELALAQEIALHNKEKAKLASELSSYLEAIGQYALVSVTDLSGNILHVNDMFREVSGYSREELVGQNQRMLSSGTHGKAFYTHMWDTISSGTKWQGEICDRAKNDELYWLNCAIVPVKSLDGEIEHYISVGLDITEQKRYEADIEKTYQDLARANLQLEQLSRVDGLTNVANRRHFDEVLSNEICRQNREQSPLTLFLCDIDLFKDYNDTYGHQAGDDCLKHVAQTIKSTFRRAGDLVARYGGEEFAVVLPNVNKETAQLLAERMRTNVQNIKSAPDASTTTRGITISVGVTTLIPDKNTTMDMLIEQADEALYVAKEKGRNNVQYFE